MKDNLKFSHRRLNSPNLKYFSSKTNGDTLASNRVWLIETLKVTKKIKFERFSLNVYAWLSFNFLSSLIHPFLFCFLSLYKAINCLCFLREEKV